MSYNHKQLIAALKSPDPVGVEAALSQSFWYCMNSLGRTDPERFGGVQTALKDVLADPTAGVFDALEKNQQKIQFSASIHDLILLKGAAHQIALQNQQRTSHESKRGASPRTPYGALMDQSHASDDETQHARRKAMGEASFDNVDTAHPTESKPPEKTRRLNRIIELPSKPEFKFNGPEILYEYMLEFLQAPSAFSNPDNSNTKTVAQEIEDNVVTLKNKIQAIPLIVRELERAARMISLTSTDDIESGSLINRRVVDLDTWFGGDRDGNKNITADTTEHAALRFAEVGREVLIEQLQPLENINEITKIIEKLTGVESEQYSSSALRRDLRTVLTQLVNTEDQENRQQLENVLIILNHISHGEHISAAQMHIRQDAGVMSDLTAALLGDEYNALGDDAKSARLLELMQTPETLLGKFAALQGYYADQLKANSSDDKARVRKDMVETFLLLPKYPNAWDLFVIANCGDGLQGSPIGKCRHIFETLLLLKIVGADHILNLAPLFESKTQLQETKPVTAALLAQPQFANFLARHNNELVVMYALSDTQRQHGPGIRWYQEEAPVGTAMAVLEHNAGKGAEARIKVKTFLGGGTDMTRGGRDPASWLYSLARKFRARAISVKTDAGERVYSDMDIHDAIAPVCMQTRQGRDGTSRFYGNEVSAFAHLSEMVANSMNFAYFLAAKPKKVSDEQLIIEDRADQKAKPIFDRAIKHFEEYFANVMDGYGSASVPWRAANALNISSRAGARNSTQAQFLTKVRAISQKGALQLAGGNDTAWLGIGIALAELPLAERRELGQSSRLMRGVVLDTLESLNRVDLDAEFQNLGLVRPVIYSHEEYQHLKELSPQQIVEQSIEVQAHWKDVQFRETSAICAETLYGDPLARGLTPAQAIRPFGRLSLETAEMDRLTRIARKLLIGVSRNPATADNPVLKQIEANLSRAVFDGMATPHNLLSPGFGDERMHDRLRAMFRKTTQPLINVLHGRQWPVVGGL